MGKSSAAPGDISHPNATMSLGARRPRTPGHRGHTKLSVSGSPRVQGGSPAGDVQVTICVDVTRALASQLKCHGGQVLGSSFHDNLPNSRVPRIEDVVKPLFQELHGFRDATINHGIQFLWEGETEALTSPINRPI